MLPEKIIGPTIDTDKPEPYALKAKKSIANAHKPAKTMNMIALQSVKRTVLFSLGSKNNEPKMTAVNDIKIAPNT